MIYNNIAKYNFFKILLYILQKVVSKIQWCHLPRVGIVERNVIHFTFGTFRKALKHKIIPKVALPYVEVRNNVKIEI